MYRTACQKLRALSIHGKQVIELLLKGVILWPVLALVHSLTST
jgi:hypothetical protein